MNDHRDEESVIREAITGLMLDFLRHRIEALRALASLTQRLDRERDLTLWAAEVATNQQEYIDSLVQRLETAERERDSALRLYDAGLEVEARLRVERDEARAANVGTMKESTARRIATLEARLNKAREALERERDAAEQGWGRDRRDADRINATLASISDTEGGEG